VLGVFLLF